MPIYHPIEADVPKPARFTYPFHYSPHRLAVMAADEVKRAVSANAEWLAEAEKGKMFGVLVVETSDGLAFLAAYSGLFCGRNDWSYFVPPVYDLLNPDGYFKQEEDEITAINHRIAALEHSPERLRAVATLDDIKRRVAAEEADFRALMAASKARRNQMRAAQQQQRESMLPNGLNVETHVNASKIPTEEELIRESQYQKAELRRMRKRHAEAIIKAEEELAAIDAPINGLKRERRERSEALQTWLFSQFSMLNARGERRDLCSIFADTPAGVPPSGAGECCAPKLLQYAYLHGLRPVCMAEFWWGASPKGEVRHHWQYYPSCRGKCLPILTHMLQGLEVDPNPLDLSHADSAEINNAFQKGAETAERLQLVYSDDDILVVDKPSGMLSVPGKGARESVYSLLKQRCKENEEPLMVHRLDMDTSGLLVVAKNKSAHKHLQQQFLLRTVKKKYFAIVVVGDGSWVIGDGGLQNYQSTTHHPSPITHLSLPLRPDPLDRPRQVVDHEKGLPAVTEWHLERIVEHDELPMEIMKQFADDTVFALLSLIPHTGRTHQLRLHCAHAEGLASPILGDPLYGSAADRLYLHASQLSFAHPTTGQPMHFESKVKW